ncbi:MAG: hypothetical protein OXF02_04405 [Simkaniaceae bacterium]|nr:hypothetical protein [Simkaniaceae bacterium]
MDDHHMPLIDTVDMEILMHRDTHFSGSFDAMIEYYLKEGVGVMPDFRVREMRRLNKLEEEAGHNLSVLYLPEPAKEHVQQACDRYRQLRDLYEKGRKDSIALRIADLILSEKVEPVKEMDALVSPEAVSPLIDLLRTPSLYDPIYPGYGRTPIFVAKILGRIGDERAIPPLFEAIGQDNFFTDEEMIKVLHLFGDKAALFLLKRLRSKPLSKDNENAAIALNAFCDRPDVAKAALDALREQEIAAQPSLASYLIFACSELLDNKDRKTFIRLKDNHSIPKACRDDMNLIIKSWQGKSNYPNASRR